MIPNALGGIIVTMTLSIQGQSLPSPSKLHLVWGLPNPWPAETMASERNEALATAPWLTGLAHLVPSSPSTPLAMVCGIPWIQIKKVGEIS